MRLRLRRQVELELSVFNNLWHTYYQEYRPLTDVFIFPPHLFRALTLVLYRGKLSRPIKQNHEKVHRKMWFWLKISICQSSMVHEGCWVNCLTRVGNLEASTVCWRESARWVQLSGNQAAVDRVRRVAVEDLVLSQEDKPKKHRSAREISLETVKLPFSIKFAAQDNSLWSPAQMLQATSCLAVVWSQSHPSIVTLGKISNLTLNSWYLCLHSFPR